MRFHHPKLLPAILCCVSIFCSAACAEQPDTLRIDGSTGVRPLVVALAEAYQQVQPGVSVTIGVGLNPEARIEALAQGEIDIAMASHGLDVPAIEEQGMRIDLFARVAVVFGVHASVPLTTLTDADLCGIYTGQVTNWNELGGPDLSIVPFARPESEVDTEIVRAHIGCFQALEMAEAVHYRETSGDLARALAETPGSIGMTTTVRVAQSEGQLQAISFNGIAPTPAQVQAQAYPLTRDSYLITLQSPPEAVVRFLDFLQGPEAGEVIRANNAVPVH